MDAVGCPVCFAVVLQGLAGGLWYYDRAMNCLRVVLQASLDEVIHGYGSVS